MGASESKTGDLKHELLFNEEERMIVSSVFCSLSHVKKSFNKENLQHFTSPVLDQVTSGRLFDLLEEPLPHKHPHKGHHPRLNEITQHQFGAHLATLLKGDVPELAHSCVFLASTIPKTVSAQDLIKFVNSILHSYERLLTAHCTAYQSWIFAAASDSHVRLARSLLSPLMKSEKAESENRSSFTLEDVTDWLSQCSIFKLILNQVFRGAFQFYPTEPNQITFQPRVPHVRDTNWSKFKTILDFPTVLFLNFALVSELQTEWKLLFNSNLNGFSFSQLLHSIKNKGANLIVIRDRDGHMFGGFASVSWNLNPKFVGNSSCFLFSIKPEFSIYKPTGYNDNFMYLNHQVQTLPNGLGMGGQFDFFGFWIDQSFDRGHSKASARGCTTYGSPQFSREQEFMVDCIEVWAVGKKKKKEGEEEDEDEEDSSDGAKAGKKSILDKIDAEDKALLDFVDKGTKSDAMREEPFTKETKEHKKIISLF